MSSLPIRSSDLRKPLAVTRTGGAGFAMLLATTFILFVRPAEIFPAIGDWPIYEFAILACLTASISIVGFQLEGRTLAGRPGMIFVLALLVAVVLSQLCHGRTYEARMAAIGFLKIVIYYVLVVSLVTSPERLRRIVLSLLLFILPMAVLALLQYHGMIEIAGMEAVTDHMTDAASGERVEVLRLQGLGIFSDPNDFSLILAAGILISAHLLINTRRFLVRMACLVPIGVFGYAFAMTRSRGGLLSLLAGALVYMVSRFGWKRAIPVAVVIVPLLLVMLGGRQTAIDLNNQDDTAQGRILLWRDSMMMFRTSPIFGIGLGQLAEENGLVAHNSFVQSFAELGVFGGTCFVGLWYCAIAGLGRRRSASAAVPDALRRLRPCILAITVGFGVGLCSLTRIYTVSTYLFLGIAAAYANVAAQTCPLAMPRLSGVLFKRVGIASVATFATIYIFIKVFAR